MPDLIKSREAFRQELSAWYQVNRRMLPWRDTPSVYKTVVSEFMLQQTQVATVLPFFGRWLRALPDFHALAGAPAAQVLKLWEGLGYYSRARNLHQLARTIAALACPPRTPAEWLELPGVGPYTAAAITSISFGEPVACVDGNVIRILARLTGENREFRDGAEAAKFFGPLAGQLVHVADPGMHNQAMMELGATVCVRANPRCEVCPVVRFCLARRKGNPADYPRFRPRQIERHEVARAWCEHKGRLLLRRGHAKAQRLAGLHELPEPGDLGVEPAHGSLLAVKRRTITRFRITESIHRVKPTISVLGRIKQDPGLEWIPVAGLAHIALSGPHRKWIHELLNGAALSSRRPVTDA